MEVKVKLEVLEEDDPLSWSPPGLTNMLSIKKEHEAQYKQSGDDPEREINAGVSAQDTSRFIRDIKVEKVDPDGWVEVTEVDDSGRGQAINILDEHYAKVEHQHRGIRKREDVDGKDNFWKNVEEEDSSGPKVDGEDLALLVEEAMVSGDEELQGEERSVEHHRPEVIIDLEFEVEKQMVDDDGNELCVGEEEDQATSSGHDIYKCRYCSKDFTFLAAKTDHEKTHSREKPFRCMKCPKAYMQPDRLLAHEQVVHEGQSPYTCGICQQLCTSGRNLKTHMKLHTGEKPFVCRFCGKAFRENHHLQQHENIHSGVKPYTCKTCSKSFGTTSALRTHETVHREERAYLCGFCGKAFKRPHQLKRHEKAHSGVKPFKCSYCEKTFTRSDHQHNHEKTHTGEGLLDCRFCNKTFYGPDNRSRHEKIHTGEKPYKCSFCEKRFVQDCQRKSHENTHRNSNIYNCTICPADFTQNRSLLKHMKIHEEQ